MDFERADLFFKIGWVASGLSQNPGSAIFFSRSESSDSFLSKSKMASQPLELFAGALEKGFEFFVHYFFWAVFALAGFFDFAAGFLVAFSADFTLALARYIFFISALASTRSRTFCLA